MKPKILAFSGSTRANSYNSLLVRAATKGATSAGAEVTIINLADYPLPLFDEDYERSSGIPDKVRAIKQLFLSHHALLISSPEYNSSLTAVLKNTIDWVSRPQQGEAPLACFKGKVAGLLAASPGALGGLRGLVHLRAILGNLSVIVIPEQYALSGADTAFDQTGSITDERKRSSAELVGKRTAEVSAKLIS